MSASSRWLRYSPSRTSTPSATRSRRSPARATRSAKVGMSVVGRLSTQKNPMSSKHLIAYDLPAPLRPVMTTKEIGVAIVERPASPSLRCEPTLMGRQDAELLAILRDRAPGDGQAAALENERDLLIGQRLGRILIRQQVLDHLLHRHRRHHLAVAGRDAGMKDEFQLDRKSHVGTP